jgi:hypothetical protein
VFQLNKQEEQAYEQLLQEFTSAQNNAATLLYLYTEIQ